LIAIFIALLAYVLFPVVDGVEDTIIPVALINSLSVVISTIVTIVKTVRGIKSQAPNITHASIICVGIAPLTVTAYLLIMDFSSSEMVNVVPNNMVAAIAIFIICIGYAAFYKELYPDEYCDWYWAR
jgi:uncharacterized membrane protein YfcA